MTQSPFDQAELLELLELAKIGEEKARELYQTATGIAEKYQLATTSRAGRSKPSGSSNGTTCSEHKS
jgi:hypothetical protein